jgi:hypothetical protein
VAGREEGAAGRRTARRVAGREAPVARSVLQGATGTRGSRGQIVRPDCAAGTRGSPRRPTRKETAAATRVGPVGPGGPRCRIRTVRRANNVEIPHPVEIKHVSRVFSFRRMQSFHVNCLCASGWGRKRRSRNRMRRSRAGYGEAGRIRQSRNRKRQSKNRMRRSRNRMRRSGAGAGEPRWRVLLWASRSAALCHSVPFLFGSERLWAARRRVVQWRFCLLSGRAERFCCLAPAEALAGGRSTKSFG